MVVIGGKKHAIAIVLFAMSWFTGCDPTMDIYFDNETELTISFDCGTVDLYGRSIGERGFVVVQNFSAQEEVTIYKDSLKVIYKGEIVPHDVLLDNEEVQSSFSSTGDFEVWLKFYIPGGIEYEEEISIYPDGYLYCNGNRMDIGAIHLNIKK